MAFTDFEQLSNPPRRICGQPTGSILQAFPPKPLAPHEGLGYIFRSYGCPVATAYDPNICPPGTVKMDPSGYGPTKHAVVDVLQSAFHCSSIGATHDELVERARDTLDRNLWRAVDGILVSELNAFPAIAQGGPFGAICTLAKAAQFLATNSYCGTGVIYGPVEWVMELLGLIDLIPKNDRYFDYMGNLIIPSSVGGNTVYAFDSEVDIHVGEPIILDEFFPALRTTNDRTVRAELVYTVAIDPCVVGTFTTTPCDILGTGGGGGGGGGGAVTVTNFPANQNVTVTNTPHVIVDNFPPDTDAPVSPLPVTVVNFPPEEPPVVQPAIESLSYTVVPGTPWTPALVPDGRIVGVSHTVVSGTVTVVDADGTTTSGVPAGFTQDWNVQSDFETLTPPQSITADPGSETIVTVVTASP